VGIQERHKLVAVVVVWAARQ